MSSPLEYIDKSVGILPDGKYFGSFGGSIVDVPGHIEGRHQIISLKYKLGGVKGFGYKVIVTVKGDDITMEDALDENGKPIGNYYVSDKYTLPRTLIHAKI